MNIKYLLEKQAMLDSNINNTRERDVEDIRMSMIAEVVEFNEELECSHKTWKSKEIDEQKQFEEFVDILFFILQEANLVKTNVLEVVIKIIESQIKKGQGQKKIPLKHCMLNFVEIIANYGKKNVAHMFASYLLLANKLGYTNEKIEAEYNRKWEVNMQRIDAEWR